MAADPRIIRTSPSLAAEVNTVQDEFTPSACWRMDDIRFDFGLSFVRPDASDEFVRLFLLMQDHPGARLSLFGHADPVGDDDRNKVLSGRRAMAVYAVLTRRADLWESLYANPAHSDRWGQAQLDTMAVAVGARAGWPYESAGQRRSLFLRYMGVLCRTPLDEPFRLDARKQFLGQGADPDGRGDYQGCSEFNPVLMVSASEAAAFAADRDKTARNAANAPNRRVVGLIFDKDLAIDLSRWPCPPALDPPTGCRQRFYSDHVTRRRFQAQRRTASGQKDTFACRSFDRMSTVGECNEVTLPFRQRWKVEITGYEHFYDSHLRRKVGSGWFSEGHEEYVPDTVDLQFRFVIDFAVERAAPTDEWIFAGARIEVAEVEAPINNLRPENDPGRAFKASEVDRIVLDDPLCLRRLEGRSIDGRLLSEADVRRLYHAPDESPDVSIPKTTDLQFRRIPRFASTIYSLVRGQDRGDLDTVPHVTLSMPSFEIPVRLVFTDRNDLTIRERGENTRWSSDFAAQWVPLREGSRQFEHVRADLLDDSAFPDPYLIVYYAHMVRGPY